MKENPLLNTYNKMKNLPLDEKKKVFIDYCLKLIEMKEKSNLTEEKVGDLIADCLSYDDLSQAPEFEAIFGIVTTLGISRELSYRQKIGEWDAKTADQMKEEEWKELTGAVYSAQKATRK